MAPSALILIAQSPSALAPLETSLFVQLLYVINIYDYDNDVISEIPSH